MPSAVPQPQDKHLPDPEGVERAVLALRWLALVIIFDLSFFDLSTEGVLVPSGGLIAAVAAYDLLVLGLRQRFRWWRRILNVFALDTAVATLAIYLTGGVHSSFLILYLYVVVGTAFYQSLLPTILVTLLVTALYGLVCFASPAGISDAAIANIVATKLTLLLLMGLVCAFLVEVLRREHQETDREAVLAARLAALNELFRQLTASLDLDQVLQTIVQAARRLLESDVAIIALLEEDRRHLNVAAAEGLDATRLTGERWAIDQEQLRTVIEMGPSFGLQEASALGSPLRDLASREGIACVISVPLTLDTVPLGFLSVAHRSVRNFTEEDLALLKPLGQQAALAIRNARLYAMEKRQVEQLRTLERLQENFISVVSHELRTPLTSIKTSVALLQETQSAGPTPVQQELWHTVVHNVERLESLVADLLQVTLLEAGRMTLTLQPTDLKTIVERAIQSIRPLFDDKGQAIEFHPPESTGRIPVDRRRLEQVLVNLLSNAHKFAPKGGWARIAIVERRDEVELCVADNGTGIPSPEQEHIFDRFYVGADPKNRSGVGLGLYITRGLVELHGGRIWVESEPGRGSIFRCVIPRREPDHENPDCR